MRTTNKNGTYGTSHHDFLCFLSNVFLFTGKGIRLTKNTCHAGIALKNWLKHTKSSGKQEFPCLLPDFKCFLSLRVFQSQNLVSAKKSPRQKCVHCKTHVFFFFVSLKTKHTFVDHLGIRVTKLLQSLIEWGFKKENDKFKENQVTKSDADE